jgi:hypothetical protein
VEKAILAFFHLAGHTKAKVSYDLRPPHRAAAFSVAC